MTQARSDRAASSAPWFDAASPPEYPPLTRDRHVAVAVIGAGITGLTTAWLLQQAGVEVAVLEADTVGAGASGGCGGQLTTCLDTPYHTLVAAHGFQVAQAVALGCERAIDFVEETVGRLRVECGFARLPGYLFAEHPLELIGLREEAAVVAGMGLGAQMVHDVPLPFTIAGALRFERQAQLDPLAYLRALARAVDQGGGDVHDHTRVLEVVDGAPCVLRTSACTLRADAVVLATHTPIGRALALQTRLEPRSNHMLVARVDAAPAALFWDRARPPHRLRAHRGQLIVSGIGERTGEPHDPRAGFAGLESYARARFAVRAIERRWSSQVFEAIDGLPFVGRLPASENVFVGCGYGGTGFTLGTVAGRMLAVMVRGHDHPLCHALRPARVHPVTAAAHACVAGGANASWRWVAARVRGHDAHLVRDLRARSGKIVEIDGQRAAVYRDRDEKLHVLSPVCTHAGCTVAWNQAASTWDCPCHGGRYHPLGAVLCAPPVLPLERDEVSLAGSEAHIAER
jgi:glycine/D-amino acid oxidase-like deaminating enzyme/nitrite reductase/ring-hydroxylating ferredoxin subunit